MTMRTYTLSTSGSEIRTRKSHIITFAREGKSAIDVALHRTNRGYAVDHPRTGLSLHQLDQISSWGPPVTLKDAKHGLIFELDELQGYERIVEACKRLVVLNASFN